jgi:hypothetical protein
VFLIDTPPQPAPLAGTGLRGVRTGLCAWPYWHQHRLNWWVAEEEGRTQPMSDLRVKEVYTSRAFVEPPPALKKT